MRTFQLPISVVKNLNGIRISRVRVRRVNHTSRRFRAFVLGRAHDKQERRKWRGKAQAKREVKKNATDAHSVMATGDLGGRGKKKTRQMEDLAP